MINFVEFSKFVGEMDVCPEGVLSSVDGRHIIKQAGVVIGSQYYMNINQDYQDMIDLMLLLEERHAIRGVNFFVGSYITSHTDGNLKIEVIIHTDKKFISDEDMIK